jgi:hypothetical protein
LAPALYFARTHQSKIRTLTGKLQSVEGPSAQQWPLPTDIASWTPQSEQ